MAGKRAMTQPAALIIGDWGNSNARVWLCADDGTVLDTRRGPGIAALRSDPAAIAAAFATMTSDWPDAVPALLAGVVGASFGWRDAGYLPCPIFIDAIGSNAIRAPTNLRDVWITPGIRCTNAWGEPDTMRGEELQIAGWAGRAASPEVLIALPGTHCKWALVEDGRVTSFHSAISGELFALLRDHSVMVDRAAQTAPHDAAAFAEGVALAKEAADVDLAALLFAARARQATGAMPPVRATSFVSGIVIGCDVRTALRHYDAVPTVAVIGDDALGQRYAAALAHWGQATFLVDGDDTMRAGLLAAAQHADLTGT
jgi:2-dehydro-3-deoxygalactonokinase